MEFRDGEKVWVLPIRFYDEGAQPRRAVIKGTQQFGGTRASMHNSTHALYVFMPEYGHEVYIDPRDVFYRKNKCRAAIRLLVKLRNLQLADQSRVTANRIMDDAVNAKEPEAETAA